MMMKKISNSISILTLHMMSSFGFTFAARSMFTMFRLFSGSMEVYCKSTEPSICTQVVLDFFDCSSAPGEIK